jgi:hypothetical protein
MMLPAAPTFNCGRDTLTVFERVSLSRMVLINLELMAMCIDLDSHFCLSLVIFGQPGL